MAGYRRRRKSGSPRKSRKGILRRLERGMNKLAKRKFGYSFSEARKSRKPRRKGKSRRSTWRRRSKKTGRFLKSKKRRSSTARRGKGKARKSKSRRSGGRKSARRGRRR